MNWKRGFLRLWIVLAVVWVAASLLSLKPWREIGYLLAESPDVIIQPAQEEGSQFTAEQQAAIDSARARLSLQEVARKQAAPGELAHIATVAFAPPAGLFLIGWLIAWVAGGFRRKG